MAQNQIVFISSHMQHGELEEDDVPEVQAGEALEAEVSALQQP
jgi:hypothetical protein